MGTRILITGGAGFIGSSLALAMKAEDPSRDVVAFDSLRRRGSELNLFRLAESGVRFVHGDVRLAEDLESVGPVDVLIECSAEPSVHAGYGESPRFLLDTNLVGAVNCLEHLRRTGGTLIFLSSSRVYPIDGLRALPLERQGERFVVADDARGPGWSAAGIGEDFPLAGARSLYGTTKLCAELLITEYAAMYGLKATVLRCGVVAGPWQMGKVDQGFLTLWVARHFFGGRLDYMGFGGEGLQVRDVLHVADLHNLIGVLLASPMRHAGALYNAGGGPANSVSPRELTALCRETTGREVAIGSEPKTRDVDVAYYVTDNARIAAATKWDPKRSVAETVEDVHRWLVDQRDHLQPLLGA